MRKSSWLAILSVLLVLGVTDAVLATVTLEFRPATQTAVAGQTFDVGLYAVANPAEPVARVEAVMTWDSTRVTLLGADNIGTSFTGASFPGTTTLNDSLTDGDGVLVTNVPLCVTPPSATPGGTLVATIHFSVGGTTGNTSIAVVGTLGADTSKVFNGLPICPGCATLCGGVVPSAVSPAVTVTVNACALATECDDLNACTNDACTAGVCTHTPNFDQATLCCIPSGAGAGTTTAIDDMNDCTDDSCDAATGVVTHVNRAVGSACGDPSFTDCTLPDTCDAAAVCLPNHRTNGVSCNSIDGCITGGTCSTGVCVGGTNQPDGTSCDDSLFCTGVMDTCTAGVCGGPSPCSGATPLCFELPAGFFCGDCLVDADCPAPPPNSCITRSCSPISQICTVIEDPNFCPDGVFCNGLEACNGVTGACDPGTNPCTAPGKLCSEALTSCVDCLADTDCDNGLPCDGLETCNMATGLCQSGTPIDCSPLDTVCEIAKCDDALGGQCVLAPIESVACTSDADCSPPSVICGPQNFCVGLNGCTDNVPCTILDSCVLGTCQGIPRPLNGGVDFRWNPSSQTVAVGDTVQVDVFFDSNDAVNHFALVIEFSLSWDPNVLSLVGNVDPCDTPPPGSCDAVSCPPGQHNWNESFFPVGARDPDGLNTTFTDGDAFYTASICPGLTPPPGDSVGAKVSPTQSLWVTTFIFTAVAPTDGPDTLLSFTDCSGPTPTYTRVIGDGPGMDITGNLGTATVKVACTDDLQCDDGNCCTLDSCAVGQCNHQAIPGCSQCQFDTDCDDLLPCTTDSCIGGCCQNIDNCPDDGLACTGVEFCDTVSKACISSGDPCPGACVEPAGCPCESPLVEPAGPFYIGVRPLPLASVVPLKILVTSPDLTCLSKFVGAPMPVDINADLVIDGMMAPLVTDPLNAAELLPEEWTGKACDNLSPVCSSDLDCAAGQSCVQIMRCSQSFIPCANSTECLSGETCEPSKVYIHGQDIIPTERGTTPGSLLPIRYSVESQCAGSTTTPVMVTMDLLGDPNGSGGVDIVDVVTAIKGLLLDFDSPHGLKPTTALEVDYVGSTTPPCEMGLPLSTDIVDVVRMIAVFSQGQTHAEFAAAGGCQFPCVP